MCKWVKYWTLSSQNTLSNQTLYETTWAWRKCTLPHVVCGAFTLRHKSTDQYRNDPKFSDRYAWANSADPDQTAPLIRVYTVCHSVCIVWTHYAMVEPHSSNFRVIITNFLGVRVFRSFCLMPFAFRVGHAMLFVLESFSVVFSIVII